MRIARRKRLKPHIDMTPLIDCVFQLLIVFMLAATFQSPLIQLVLPHAATKDESHTPEVVISVDDKGKYHVNGEAVDVTRLEDHLRPLVAKTKDRVVTFRGDRTMPYEHFVRAVDAARAAGAIHIDVAHQGG
jgi:biopolymer transport protein ExbD